MGLVLYPAVIERTSEGFAVFFPGVACRGAGGTMAAAVADAKQGLAAYFDAARDNGIEVPAPPELDKIKVAPGIDEVARVLVRYEPPSQSVRINIPMDEALLKRVDSAAERDGYTRSGFLANAVRRCLSEDAWPYAAQRLKKAAPSVRIGRDARTGALIRRNAPAGKSHGAGASVRKKGKRK